jgi:hypothetical protein
MYSAQPEMTMAYELTENRRELENKSKYVDAAHVKKPVENLRSGHDNRSLRMIYNYVLLDGLLSGYICFCAYKRYLDTSGSS